MTGWSAMLRALSLTCLLALTALAALATPAAADFTCAADVGVNGVVCYDADRHYYCTIANPGGGTLCLQHVNFDRLWCPFEQPILQCVL